LRIDTIEIDNYRQYRHARIQLPARQSGQVAVFIGSNGTGKTNLLNAITWCLHGREFHLTSEEDALPIFNIGPLDAPLPDTAETVVKLRLSLSDGVQAVVTRKAVTVARGDGGWLTSTEDPVVQVRTPEGWPEQDQPTFWIQSNMPDDIRPFFLFDGERLDDLFRHTETLDVRAAVLRIAQVDLLERLQEHLQTMKDEALKEVAAASKHDQLKRAEAELATEKARHLQQRERLESLREQQKVLREEYNRLAERRQSAPDPEKFDRQKALEDDLDQLTKEIYKEEQAFYSWVGQVSPFVFGFRAMEELLARIAKAEEDKMLPPKMQPGYLKQLLSEGVCICGGSLDEGQRDRLEQMLRRIEEANPEASVLSYLEPTALQAKALVANIKKEWEEKTNLIADLRAKEGKVNEELQEISAILRRHEEKEVRDLQRDHDRVNQELQSIASDIALAERDLTEQAKLVEESEEACSVLVRIVGCHDGTRTRFDFVVACLKVVTRTYQGLDRETRERVAAAMESYFLQLLNVIKSGTTYTGVTIDDHYRVRVVHAKSRNATGTLSAGERECLALAFSLALGEVSGFDLPFVIDTPLGRLDENVSEHTSLAIASQAEHRQVVLLMQPAEYSEAVKRTLHEFPLAIYDLKFDSDEQETKVVLRGAE
jgi:DNA sulfur modification protein DndD